MNKRIIISVSSDLSTDQRIQKVAKSCFNHGYDVLLIGRKFKNSSNISFPYKYKRFGLCFNSSFLFYAELNIRLFFFLLFSKADIFLSNDTDTLPANYMVSLLRRKKLVFDAHELFPEVPELVNRVFVKRFWESIENRIFPKLKYSYTVCQSIADYYHTKYGINMGVVRNVPYSISYPKSDVQNKKYIIYQGALNKGRCLEYVIEAMKYVIDAQLIIIGDGDLREELQKLSKKLHLNNNVKFYGRMMPEEMRSYTSNASLGLCLLENCGLSYYYSLPNRIFDYLHAGIPVLATDFPEIKKVVATHNTGVLINHYEPLYLAGIMNKLLQYPFDTNNFKSLAMKYCWEIEENKLLEIIDRSVSIKNT